jgi:hypothetical protein
MASWFALFCFVAVATASLVVLWPRRWEGGVSPRDVIETYVEAEEVAPIEELHRDLSIHMHNSYLANQEALKQLAVFLQVASGLLTLEVLSWVIAVAVTL